MMLYQEAYRCQSLRPSPGVRAFRRMAGLYRKCDSLYGNRVDRTGFKSVYSCTTDRSSLEYVTEAAVGTDHGLRDGTGRSPWWLMRGGPRSRPARRARICTSLSVVCAVVGRRAHEFLLRTNSSYGSSRMIANNVDRAPGLSSVRRPRADGLRFCCSIDYEGALTPSVLFRLSSPYPFLALVSRGQPVSASLFFLPSLLPETGQGHLTTSACQLAPVAAAPVVEHMNPKTGDALRRVPGRAARAPRPTGRRPDPRAPAVGSRHRRHPHHGEREPSIPASIVGRSRRRPPMSRWNSQCLDDPVQCTRVMTACRQGDHAGDVQMKAHSG